MPKFKDYKSQYLDPRWQKRRLEIMQMDDFTCQHCGDKESTLNVHHRAYRKGADVWDYSSTELVTLCAHCHEVTEALLGKAKQAIGHLTPGELHQIIGFAQSLHYQRTTVPLMRAEKDRGRKAIDFSEVSDGYVVGFLQAFLTLRNVDVLAGLLSGTLIDLTDGKKSPVDVDKNMARYKRAKIKTGDAA